jgi:hypothetical protein
MVIDEFVYNPATGTGKITASVTRGTLRLISGRIARQEQEAIQIKLPVATVGIRGSMVMFSGGPNGFFIGLFGVGPDNSANRPQSLVTVLAGGVLTEIFRSGWGCQVKAPTDPCRPELLGPEFLQQLLGQIGGQIRFIDLSDFERYTGLDLVSALNLMNKPGGFEDFWQTINNLFQDQTHPPEFTPPPPSNGYGPG